MKLAKSISISLVTISILSLTGCGGGGGSSTPTEETTDNKSTGYFIDSGVEGLTYKIDGTSYTTGTGGSLECVVGKDKLQFYIGDKALGNEVSCAVQITPEKLIDEALTKDNYSDNTQAVNVMRLLQSLDEDGNPENGITISTDTHTKVKNSNQYINLYSSLDLDNLVKDVDSNKYLISETSAKSHYNNSMFLIQNNLSSIQTDKQKLFNRYTLLYFQNNSSEIQGKTLSKKEVANSVNNAVSSVADYITITSSTTKITDTTKEVLKDIVGEVLSGTDEQIVNLAIDMITEVIKYKQNSATASKSVAYILDNNMNAILDTIASTGAITTTYANSLKSDSTKLAILTDVTSLVTESLILYKNVQAANGGDPTGLISQTLTTTANAINTGFQEYYALNNEEDLLSKVIIPQTYLRLYYYNGETNSGVAQALGLSSSATTTEIYNKISSISAGNGAGAISEFVQWFTGKEDLQHSKSKVDIAINEFKEAFDRRVSLKMPTTNLNEGFILEDAYGLKHSYNGDEEADTNYNNSKLYTAGEQWTTWGTGRTFIKLDISNIPATVTNIELKLYAYSGDTRSGYDAKIELYKITEDWKETNITWNTTPNFNKSKMYDSLIIEHDTIEGWYSFNITEIVKEWQSGESNNGIILYCPDNYSGGGYRNFYSKDNLEHPDKIPTIIFN